jgi:hypothetical protein
MILCPKHEEDTPSCAVYSDGWKCYGCGAWGPLSSLPGNYRDLDIPQEKEPEDLDRVFQYIDRLALKEIRGLSFPCDDQSFYIVWPGKTYYKRRFFNNNPKYKCPSGHTRQWFVANSVGSKTCILVEGEINALSIAKACPEFDVISPGSASDFSSQAFSKRLHLLATYNILLLVADKDQAGAQALINAKSILDTPSSPVAWMLTEKDANEVLCESGKEQLRKEILRALGRDLEDSPI